VRGGLVRIVFRSAIMARRRTVVAQPVTAKTVVVRFKQVTQRAALIASVSLLGLTASGVLGLRMATAKEASQTLTGTKILPGGRWTGARLPTVAQTNNGLVMTIKQEQKAALMDWSQFDVGASEEVHFEQGGADWIALNRIFSANPSQIAGKITAKGQVWLANTNGVIFKGTARVNTASMLVTTTVMPDAILDGSGLLSGRIRDGGWYEIPGLLEGAVGDIVIDKGAELTFKSSDPTVTSSAMFLGVNVINHGKIDITDGQLVMMAGEDFVLRAGAQHEMYNYDFLRGVYGLSSAKRAGYGRYNNEARWNKWHYDRAEELGLSVINDGVINATRGTILMQGASVVQNGILTATTGVRQRTGAILLRAGFAFDDDELYYSNGYDRLAGDITFGKGSLTQVAPETGDDASPALETFTGSKRSRISVVGRDVLMEENATLRAKGGLITVDGNYNASMIGDFPGADRGKPGSFVMRQGALIDVSGVSGVKRDVSDNIVDVEIRANELSASPLQRDGILYGEDVKVDIRQGAGIVDWTGALANRNLTAEDRSINGGEVQIRALSAVQIENGAKIDLSGGSADYAGGWVDVTQLTAADGRVFDIATADAGLKYTGLTKTQRFEAGYTEGGDAGRLEILSSSQKLFGRVVADTVIGSRQLAAGVKGAKPATPTGSIDVPVSTRAPKGGSVTLGTGSESLAEYFFDQLFVTPDQGAVNLTVNGGQVTLDPSKLGTDGKLSGGGYTQVMVGEKGDQQILLAPGWAVYRGKAVDLRQALIEQGYDGADLEALMEPDATLPTGFQRGRDLAFSFVEDDFFAGAETLTILNKSDAKSYNFNITDGARIQLRAGGAMNLSATPANIGRNVVLSAAGGNISVLASRIGDGSVLSVAGTWTNDLDGAGQWGGRVDGGSITVVGAVLDGDVTFDASGGGWWKQTSPATAAGPGGFELVNGKGGSIALTRAVSQDGATLLDRADFKLGGLGGAGSLRLDEMGDVVIGPAGGSAPAGALFLSDAKLNGWGLGSLSINGGLLELSLDSSLIGRVSQGVRDPNITDPNDPNIFIIAPGTVITAEGYQAILAANVAAAAYNAGLPPGANQRQTIGTLSVTADIDVRAGAKLDLAQKVLVLNTPASQIATGADLSQFTTAVVPPAHLAAGTTFNLGYAGNLTVADGATIKVATNGAVGLSGSVLDIGGDITALSGKIDLVSTDLGSLRVRASSFLDARGEVVSRLVQGGAPGQSWTEGVVHAGGAISLGGGDVIVERGARLDVSGAAGVLTISAPSRLGMVRIDRLIGGDAGTISVGGQSGYLAGDLRGAAGVGFNGVTGRAGILNLTGGAAGRGVSEEQLSAILDNIISNGLENYGFANLAELAEAYLGAQPGTIEPIPIDDPVALRAFLAQAFAGASATDPAGFLALDPTLVEAGPARPPAKPYTPEVPDGYVLQTNQAAYIGALSLLIDYFGGANYRDNFANIAPGKIFHIGQTPLAAAAGFDTVNIDGQVRVDSDLTLKALRSLTITSLSAETADVILQAPIITFTGGLGLADTSADGGEFKALAQTINVSNAAFGGFSKVTLEATRSLSGGSKITPDGLGGSLFSNVYAPGALVIRAGQVYPHTGTALGIFSDTSITFERAGSSLAAPLSAGGKLVIEAPLINQGGVLSAPFGVIEFEGEEVNFLPGSLTTVSADNRTILYGHTIDGSNWWGPTPDSLEEVQLDTPPEKRIVVSGDKVDLRAGAVIDASGGGDVLGLEFVQGPKGAANILTGEGVFAISPVFGDDVSLGQAPSTAPREQLAVGDVIWLPAFDGHAAGYYTLLPAEYALTPGGYRVTVAQAGAASAAARQTADGSFILTGHQAGEQGVAFGDQGFTSFQVMSGAGVRERSEFIETSGNSFFSSERFLTGLERSGAVYNADPRLPVDGGFMTIAARESLQLNGEFRARGATSADRGGVLDIAGDRIVVASAGTDISDLGAGYLRLDPKQLSNVAESLLIGGVRRQGEAGLEIVTGYDTRNDDGTPAGSSIGAERIVVRNSEADALTGVEILFAATDQILFETGSVVRAVGDGAQAADVILRPELGAHTTTTMWPAMTYAAEDRGAFVRVSNLGDVAITRTNAKSDRGDVILESGARLEAVDAVAVNATRDTTLEPGAILKAGVIEAAAGHVSFGDAPSTQNGLVLNDAAFAALASAQTLRLRSFSTFDIYGDVNLTTGNNLVLDGGGLVNVDGQSNSVFTAKTLTLTNTDAPVITPTATGGGLKLNAETVAFGEGVVGLGFADIDVDAKGRVLFSGAGKINAPGSLTIRATEVAAASGASHGVTASGAVEVLAQAAPMTLTAFQTAGATLDLKGQSVTVDLPVVLSSGVFRASATTGDVTIGDKARINVSGSAIKFYEVTEYLAAGGIGLTSESGDVILAGGSVLDLSGGQTGDAGDLIVSAGRGVAVLDGQLKASAGAGGRGGAFTLQTSTLADFGALNAKLNTSGFNRSRRFSVVSGDVDLTGVTQVDAFELSTGQGSITVDGAAQVITTGAKGGKIVIASGGDLIVEDGALLDASAKGAGAQRGGVVSLQVGDAGALDIGAAVLKVGGAGTGEAGEVRLRARQIGGDVAVDRYLATVDGGATILEAYRVTDLGAGDHVIDTALQGQVVAQATAFMTGGNVSAIRTRLGQADANAFKITPGIEIRAGGDLTLKDEWNLAPARFGGQPGVLTLRAGGDLSLDANLSDGFLSAQQPTGPLSTSDPASANSPLTNDESWSYNLVAGADLTQANVLSTLASATGEGDVKINAIVRTGTGDINVAASGDLNYKPVREYQFDITQALNGDMNVAIVYPDGTLHNYTAVQQPDGAFEAVVPDLGKVRFSDQSFYASGAISIEAGSRVIAGDYDNDGSRAAFSVQYVDGALYTAGREAAPLANFDSPTQYWGGDPWGTPVLQYRPASFLEKGGDITIAVGGDINGAGDALLDSTWYGKRAAILPTGAGVMDSPFNVDRGGIYQQTAFWITPDSFRQGVGALGGGDVTIRAGGTVDNLVVALPTTTRVAGGRTLDEAKVLDIRGGGDLEMSVGGDLLGGSLWVGKGTATIDVDGRMDKTAEPDIENPYRYQSNLGGFTPDRRQQGHGVLIIDDATMRITTGGDARFATVRSSANENWDYQGANWLAYTERTKLEVISSGGDVQYYAASGREYEPGDILPSKTRLVSISGSVMLGDWKEQPQLILTDSFPGGQFDLLARKDIGFWNMHSTGQSQKFNGGYGQRGYDAPGFALSWGDPNDAPRALNPFRPGEHRFSETWGGGGPGYGRTEDSDNLNEGSDHYARIYTIDGDIYQAQGTMEAPIYSGTPGAYGFGNFIFGYETRIKAGDDIRMGVMEFLNQDADDVSTVQAGGSIYLPDVTVYGEGRLWVQAGDEIYMGTTPGAGIRAAEDIDYADRVEDNGADVSVLAGIDQDPSYDPFFEYYLGTGDLATKPIYLSEYYTFDAIGLGTPHATTLADGQTEVTVYAVDLVNYWNEMHGRPPISLEDDKGKPVPRGTLISKISKADYEAAATWLADLDPVKKRGLATRIMYAELKTSGREAVGASSGTDPSSTRFGDPSRGYAAVGKLFPGAQRKPGEAKQAGEARWFGDLIMTNSQIRADGGGDVDILVPGGLVQLASLSVSNTDPNNSGVLSQDGGAVNVLTYGDYIVNQSRTMTADDGDIMIWSSFGNIDAGKGRKSSLSIPPVIFPVDINGVVRVLRSGLPNGAGIATLNRVDGTPGGDVDLYAFNGIVNAGDAGIRASRDLFVGALEIRGLDNITVGGVTNVELNTEEAELGPINLENFAQAAEDDAIAKAFDMSAEVEKLRTVTQTILTGSVVSFGEDPDEEKKRK
jgi:filamentous hemagglutinin family protein